METLKQLARPGWHFGRAAVAGLFAIVLILAAPAPAQQTRSPVLQERIAQLLGDPKWQSGFWGIHIVSLKHKTVLFSSNAGRRFMPASNLKLLIAAAALERMGPDFQFETPIYAGGPIDSQGRLLGPLVLVGKGDPNLEGRRYDSEQEELPARDLPEFMARIVEQVLARGVRSILGDIVADETYFLHEPLGPAWTLESLPWGYSAPVSALAVNENFFTLEFWPGETAGELALARTYPVESEIELVNRVRTVQAGQPASIEMERSRDGTLCTFQGNVPVRHPPLKYNLAVIDAGQFAAQLLKSALVQRGLTVTGKARTRQLPLLEVLSNGKLSLDKAKELQTRYPEERKLASITTVPLLETLKILMKSSHNLYAEMLLRVLGAQTSGIGSTETGRAVLEEFASKTGTPPGLLSLSDGSGLSRKNLMTPESIVRLLEYMDQHPLAGKFFDLLPVAGRDGTLKNRMKKTIAAERVFAKTGAIEFVVSLSGYAITEGGEKLAFSIMVNHELASSREVREAIDEICNWMVQYESAREPSGAVLKRQNQRR